jgi:hypothetical protein
MDISHDQTDFGAHVFTFLTHEHIFQSTDEKTYLIFESLSTQPLGLKTLSIKLQINLCFRFLKFGLILALDVLEVFENNFHDGWYLYF